jgi:Zn-dependent peptidase ImmA (M78 family)/DNA-binding XRE family transcriptional regulator
MKVNPERLELVRSRLGLSKSEFASKLDIDRKTIQRFAKGDYDLNDAILARIVALSGYPINFLTKGTPELPNAESVSFRSLRSLTARPRGAALAAAAIAFELDDWVHERFDLPSHDLPQIVGRSPQEAAIGLRTRWGMGVRPISNMINVLETHGVRVFSLSEETRHLDAYSFWRNEKPYVFLNTCKTAEHSRFDAAHELAHLVLHGHSGSKHRSAEEEAHNFASEFLMPSSDVIARVPFVRSLKDLVEAKKRWGVSVASLVYCLKKIGVLSEWTARGFYIELNRLGRESEPEPMQRETSQIWTKVLTALWREGVTMSRIASDLNVPERELNNLLFNIATSVSAPPPTYGGMLRLV